MNTRILLCAVLVSCLIVCGCVQTNRATGRKELVLIGEPQEQAMGLQFAQKLSTEQRLVASGPSLKKVQGIGDKIAAQRWRKGITYRFHVIDDVKTVNAYALPGGYIYITTGLLAALKTDNEVAAVLAHEVGHVEARHNAKHVEKALLAQGLTAAVFSGEDQRSRRQVSLLFSSLLLLRFTRHQELEADRIGIDYARGAGYDAWGMVSLLETLRRLEKKGGASTPLFLRTHPLTDKRIEEARKHAASKTSSPK